MESEVLLLLLGVVVLLICSAFFSGSETALMSLSKPKLHKKAKEGDEASQRIAKVLNSPEKLLSTILLGNNLVNIGASALTTGLFIKFFGSSGIAIATVVMTFVVLIFAEILPKTLASRNPEGHSRWISYPMTFLIYILTPFTALVRWVSKLIMIMLRINHSGDGSNFEEDDVKGAIVMGLEEGVLEKGAHRMLDTIMELNDITVEDVMTHRNSLYTMDIKSTMKQIKTKLDKIRIHSRVPLWDGDKDNIVGILHVKDFYRAFYDDEYGNKTSSKAVKAKGASASKTKKKTSKLSVQDIMQKPYFVPETVTIGQQLMEFRVKRRHMALVVDEYGDLQGLITMEDIFEEIVGEIEDEHDIITEGIVRESNGSITVEGSYTIRDINREFGWELDEEEAVTIAGLLIEETNKIPVVGERVTINGITFKVTAKKRQTILKVNIILPAKNKTS